MPQKKKAQNDSDSDTSDVSLNSDDGSKKQPAKKAKTETKGKTDSKPKSSSSSGNSDEKVFELGSNKQVTVREFRGKLYVDIREFYMDKNSGEMRPGKKGVSLPVDMWRKLCDLKDDINEAIKNS